MRTFGMLNWALASILFLVCTAPAHAQEVVPDSVTFVKGEVTEVVAGGEREIPGTGTSGVYQTIRAKVLEGADTGLVITIDNDYLKLGVGDVVYLRHTVNTLEGRNTYSVAEPYRLPMLGWLTALFLVCLVVFGGTQGIRGLAALVASLFFIVYLLLPGILAGYPPVLVALGVASIIIVAGSYLTHGFNRATHAAVLGMLATIAVTGLLAYLSIHYGRLSGYSSEEATYLNFNTRGAIDFVGLLLGGLLIGFLGVLYDAAISQAIAVEELASVGPHLSRRELMRRGLRIGREHIGALVNTLAIAYVGASLPLLLLFRLVNDQSPLVTINQELFATEIVRTMVGSIGLILAVPITTAIAVYLLHGRPPRTAVVGHAHHH